MHLLNLLRMFLCLSLKRSFQLLKPGLITFLRVEMLFLNQFSISKGHFPVVYSENFYQGRHAGYLFCNAREIKEKKMRFLKEIKRQIL